MNTKYENTKLRLKSDTIIVILCAEACTRKSFTRRRACAEVVGVTTQTLFPGSFNRFFVFTSGEKQKLENEVKGKDLTEIDF